MVAFLIKRPVAVLLSFLGAVIFSLIVFSRLPVSLLPLVDVPQIVIKVNAPNKGPQEIESTILSKIREGFLSMSKLEDINTLASSESGTVKLRFNYGTDMNLAYIDANERMDRLMANLPDNLYRPQVIKINTTDIPVVKVQVLPAADNSYTDLSVFVNNVLKKRLEQVEGVSLVDINGLGEQVITVDFHTEKLRTLLLTTSQLSSVINSSNRNLGGISVKDGQYRYFVKVENTLKSAEELAALPVKLPEGGIIRLGEVADIAQSEKEPSGLHLFQEQRGVVLNVHKQQSANMIKLVERLQEATRNFSKDYPFISLTVTGDQSELLRLSLDNLRTGLLFGGCFAFLILFAFFGNYRLPVIMGISLPVTLLICFLFFSLFGVTINVISLSGLALGLGMLIDNAIIVVDNITRKRKGGQPLFQSITEGVNEVIPALISSVLTTLAVFVPLIFLSGITGALFVDQAISVAIILVLSLAVAFILIPLLYRLFFRKRQELLPEDSRSYNSLQNAYERMFFRIYKQKWITLLAGLLFTVAGLLAVSQLEIQGLPKITRQEKEVIIRWNEPLTLEENKQRVNQLTRAFSSEINSPDADLGYKQYLMAQEDENFQSVKLQFNQINPEDPCFAQKVEDYIKNRYPLAAVTFSNAPNAFEQLFTTTLPFLEGRISDPLGKEPLNAAQVARSADFIPASGFDKETIITLNIDRRKLGLYGFNQSELLNRLTDLLGDRLVTELKSYGTLVRVLLKKEANDIQSLLARNFITSPEGQSYALASFVEIDFSTGFSEVYADKTGTYQSVRPAEGTQPEFFMNSSREFAGQNNWEITFTGTYFTDRQQLEELFLVLMVSVLLLYFILAAQFESLIQPVIVILTVPVAIAGSLMLLLVSGSSLNIMAAIGIIVMIGIIVNDSILKIDTINRLVKSGLPTDRAIHQAGLTRLKPILMTSVTTVLALLPVVFFDGAGAELQFPLVMAVIGGLSVGTIASLFLIPVLYRIVRRR